MDIADTVSIVDILYLDTIDITIDITRITSIY